MLINTRPKAEKIDCTVVLIFRLSLNAHIARCRLYVAARASVTAYGVETYQVTGKGKFLRVRLHGEVANKDRAQHLVYHEAPSLRHNTEFRENK